MYKRQDLDEALSQKPDFAVLCVPREIAKDYLVQLMEKGIPVLCETPPGKNVAELNELWTLSQKYNGRVQIVEQYFLQPYYASILDIIKQGYLGTTSSVMLSAPVSYTHLNYASDEAKEIARLQRELRDTKDALEVLKKAIGILGK